jgi:hypothetical protein
MHFFLILKGGGVIVKLHLVATCVILTMQDTGSVISLVALLGCEVFNCGAIK